MSPNCAFSCNVGSHSHRAGKRTSRACRCLCSLRNRAASSKTPRFAAEACISEIYFQAYASLLRTSTPTSLSTPEMSLFKSLRSLRFERRGGLIKGDSALVWEGGAPLIFLPTTVRDEYEELKRNILDSSSQTLFIVFFILLLRAQSPIDTHFSRIC